MPAARIAWHVLTRLRAALLAASFGGWLLLFVLENAFALPALCRPTGGGYAAGRGLEAVLGSNPASFVLLWGAMLLAMMAPLLAPPLLHVWRRSLTRRRVRAVALFLLGYAVVWVAAGSLLAAGAFTLGSVAQAAGLPPLAIAALVLVGWQATPVKQISLNRCHGRPPLAAFGLRAEADALRYGANHGVWCVGACWAFMLLPLATDGLLHWTMMVLVMLIAIVERARVPGAARWGAAWPGLPQLRFGSPLGSSA